MTNVVSNASPLIVLAKAGLLRLLPVLFSRVFVPGAVLDEIQAGLPSDPMKRMLPSCSWLVAVRLEPAISAAWRGRVGR